MSLRDKLQGTATRLIAKNGDEVDIIAETVTDGVLDTDPPTISKVYTPIDAIAIGAGRWADGKTILMSDLRVTVSGVFDLLDVGDKMRINGKEHTIISHDPKLATGVKSVVIYFVRRG